MFKACCNRAPIIICLALLLFCGRANALSDVIEVAFIKQIREYLPKLSNLDLRADDEGVLGLQQGVIDNNGTAIFIDQKFASQAVILEPEDDPLSAFQDLYERGIRHFIVDIPAKHVLALASAAVEDMAWFYNVGAADDALRSSECLPNLFHINPSDSMKADALAQFFVAKRWQDWFLVVGRRQADRNFAAAIRRSAKKFGAKIVAEKNWDYGPDARRTAQADVPVFTQGIDYDVLMVADSVGEFGEYLMYRTWQPRLVAGTQGLYATSWHHTHEVWGAAQMQSRFGKRFNRRMTETEYGVWAAMRVIGEAATRTQSVNNEKIAHYIESDQFELAGYKGQKLTFRQWNGQLRQPVLLVWERSLVSVSPQAQFLHQRSQLDTLGFDQPEVVCE